MSQLSPNIFFFLRHFALSCFKHNLFASLCLLFVLILNYFFQFFIIKIQKQLIIINIFIYAIQQSVLQLFRIPIRNTAIITARTEYLESLLKNTPEKYQKSQNGQILFKLKRIEIIFCSLEADFLSFVTHFPSAILNFVIMIL